jgi:hypothetical protein
MAPVAAAGGEEAEPGFTTGEDKPSRLRKVAGPCNGGPVPSDLNRAADSASAAARVCE